MYRGVVHAHIEQGMHWSVVEHLLLFALSRAPFTTETLARYARLPQTIVVEAVTRLMRAGWIDIVTDDGRTHFQASASGREEVLKESLTPIVRSVTRNLHFAVDRVTGAVVAMDNLKLRHARDIADQRRQCRTLRAALSDDPEVGYLELIDRLSVVPGLVRSDEKIVGCDPYRSSIEADWYLSLTASGDVVEGLPPSPAPHLLAGIKRAVARLSAKEHASREEAPPEPIAEQPHKAHAIDLHADDLILGGAAHEAAFRSAIKSARRRVIVHSTFLSATRLQEQLDVLRDAAGKDVRVDLLWDRCDEGKHTQTLKECRALLERCNLQDAIRLSSFQTRSHSKQIVADDGAGGYFAIVGSCNWLSSPFKSYEASVRLRSAPLAAECLSFIEKMLPLDSDTGDLKEELIALGMQLRGLPATVGTAMAALLSQGAHEAMIGKARDSAERSIFVASNKAGNAVETQVLAPFDSAARDRPLAVSVYYQDERANSALTPEVMVALKHRYSLARIETVKHAHAKLLCWDSDHAVVTSLNWLSKDAPSANFVGECGVYVESTGIADLLRRSYLCQTGKASK